jgi:hypothetical protein
VDAIGCDNLREAMANDMEVEQLNSGQHLYLRELSEPRHFRVFIATGILNWD